jgi:hypothetical protein
MSHALIKSLLREMRVLIVEHTDPTCRQCASAHVECLMAAYRCSQRVYTRCRVCGEDERVDMWCDEDDEAEEDEEDCADGGRGKEQRRRSEQDVAVVSTGGRAKDGGAADVEGAANDTCVRAVRQLAQALVAPTPVPLNEQGPVAVVVSSPVSKPAAKKGSTRSRTGGAKTRSRPARSKRTTVDEFGFEGGDADEDPDASDSLGETGDEDDDVVRRLARRRRRRRLREEAEADEE